MPLFVSDKHLQLRDELTSLKAAVDAQRQDHEDHLRDCMSQREETKKAVERVMSSVQSINVKMDQVNEERAKQHIQNTRFLISILLSCLGGLILALGSVGYFVMEHSLGVLGK